MIFTIFMLETQMSGSNIPLFPWFQTFSQFFPQFLKNRCDVDSSELPAVAVAPPADPQSLGQWQRCSRTSNVDMFGSDMGNNLGKLKYFTNLL